MNFNHRGVCVFEALEVQEEVDWEVGKALVDETPRMMTLLTVVLKNSALQRQLVWNV